MLSVEEIDDTVQWLLANNDLNLVAYDEADLYRDNYITHVYLAEPNKEDALAYLKTGENRPARYAHVHLSLAGLETPCMRQYTVGPLPTGSNTVLSSPIVLGGVSDVPFDARQTSTKEYDRVDKLVLKVMGQIDEEMRDSFGTNYYADCPDDFCLTYSDTSPRGPDRDMTLWFLFDVEGFFANPVGLYLTFHMGGLKKTNHRLKLIVYNGQSFDSIEEFKQAYSSNTLIKLSNRPLNQVLINNANGLEWASLMKNPNPAGVHTGRGKRTRRNSNIPAPQVQEPAGHRFSLKDGHLEYLGWSLNVGHSPITGLKMYNVRFRGERVAYEIGLSEAIAVYSGVNDLVQATTVYGDSAWGMGASAKEAVRGIDCPSTGILTDISFLYDSGEATVSPNTICIFENVGQAPLRRHSNGDDYGGLALHSLVIRIVLPVYNYDYVFDHVLHLNGGIELRGSTSGYLQSTFWSPELQTETEQFGQRIGPFTAGTTHDHVINFKIDLDVKGTENSLVKTTTQAVKATPQDINGKPFKLSNFKVAGDYMTKKSEHTVVQREQGFTMSGAEPMMFSVVSSKGRNQWGAKQGYKLKLNGVVQNLVADTKSLRAYSFSKHTLAATVRHEDEPTVSSIYDQSDTTGTIMKSVTGGVARPLVDMDRFLADKEKLAGSDLVLWVNVGVLHHTHAEDIPVTTTTSNTVNIFLLPFNLYDYDDSMDLGNSLYSKPGEALQDFDLMDAPEQLCPMEYAPLGEGYVSGGLE